MTRLFKWLGMAAIIMTALYLVMSARQERPASSIQDARNASPAEPSRAPATPSVTVAAEARPGDAGPGETTSVTITVRDAVSGHMVDGCVLRMESGEARCDSRGILSLDTTGWRFVVGELSAPGYAKAAVEVPITRPRLEMDFLLRRGASVAGLVVDTSGRAISGATVTLKRAGSRDADVTMSGAEGRFTFESVVPGRVELTVEAGSEDRLFGHAELVLAAGEARSGVRIVVDAGGRIVGHVLNPDGSPVTGLKTVSYGGVQGTGGSTTAMGDEFELEGLLPGVYSLNAHLKDGREAFLEGVSVKAHETTSVTLRIGSATLEGVVHDSRGQSVDGARILVLLESGPLVARTVADAGGHFAVAGLPGGPFRVVASDERRYASVMGAKAGAHLEIVLHDTGVLKGEVTAAGGHAADTCTVRAVEKKRRPGVSGAFLAILNAGSCSFLWEEVAPGTYEITASSPGKTDASTIATVDEGRTTEVLLRLGAGATVTGHVTADGRAVSGCIVGMGAVTASDGAFELPGLPEGRTRLTAMCPDGSGGATEVEVEGDHARGEVNIAVSPGPHDEPPKVDFGGIGAALGTADGYPMIRSAMDDTPSAQAGLEPGDTILAVNGRSASGVALNAIIDQIRGPVGSPVVLTIRREGVPEPFDVYLQRQRIVVQ